MIAGKKVLIISAAILVPDDTQAQDTADRLRLAADLWEQEKGGPGPRPMDDESPMQAASVENWLALKSCLERNGRLGVILSGIHTTDYLRKIGYEGD